jgi:SAM-dependent methyltransferase
MNSSGRLHTLEQIKTVLARIANDYPPDSVAGQLKDVDRIAFHIEIISAGLPASARVADIGGGLGLFPPGCAAVGLSIVVVDDFCDPGNTEIAAEVFARVHHKLGVEIVSRDVIAEGVRFPRASLDVVTTFESMEHWHHSPKKLFRQLLDALKPGGKFVIGVPNCVNLRKRLTVPLGINKWSALSEWYEREVFRGHVREPDVDDLRYIACDLGLVDIEILGRNWLGYGSRYGWIRALTPLMDFPLRVFPGLCSDLYLVGRKPAR